MSYLLFWVSKMYLDSTCLCISSYSDLYFISISCYSVKQMVPNLLFFFFNKSDPLLVEAVLQMLHAGLLTQS